MPFIRSRLLAGPVAVSLLFGLAAVPGPVSAADSPEAAVDELFDIVTDADFARITEVVCAADQAAARDAFDVGSQLGLGEGDALASALAINISDRAIEPVSVDGDIAVVKVAATMSMSVADDQVEDLVRAILEAEAGPDDPPASEANVEMMVGLMGSAFNQTQRIEEEVSVIREDGEWLVCGGLWEEPEEPPIGEASWSGEGLCALLAVDEVNAVGTLQYASAAGFETVCTISSSMGLEDGFHSATLSLNEGYQLATFEGVFGVDEEREVAGYPAFSSGDQVLVQVGEDVLQVSVFLDENAPDGVDAVTQAIGLAALVAPRLASLVVATPEPTLEPTPEESLCASLTLDELNELTGLALEQADGDASSCQYMSLGGGGGFHFVVAYVGESDLATYELWVSDYEEASIAGLPAMVTAQQTLVELPDGPRVLDVTVVLDPADEAVSMTAAEVGALVAERLLPGLLEG
jgi:hypothetical protein